MSLRSSKKMSAFSVFKSRKGSSMTDVQSASKTPSSSNGTTLKKSASAAAGGESGIASASSSANSSSISSIFKVSSTDKKKQKAEMKKLKKALKNASQPGARPSFIPDSAIHSPLVTGKLTNGKNVELKSLRPKGSMGNISYQLPLRATPDVGVVADRSSVDDSKMSFSVTPDVLKKSSKVRDSSDDSFSRPSPKAANNKVSQKAGKKRINSAAEMSPSPAGKRVSRHQSERTPKNDVQPPKRRRVSSLGSSQPSPGQFSNSSQRAAVLSPEGARERMEPLPMHPADRDPHMPYMFDSQAEAKRLFECLIHPVKPNKFFSELWEEKPLLVKRHNASYNAGWFSTEEFHKILKENNLVFGTNVDVVTYENGKRETHNPVGRAYPPVVWDHYQNGCSVRLLNPHTYSNSVWKLLSILQEYFSCMVGANVYLTPPGTQGFAPHYDDIEAFILQLEGKKHWRLYSPRENEKLARYSSSNFTDKDIGQPILDVILEAGDLLYFPKGTIHQGRTLEDAHSLHITVSCEQLNSWGDMLEKLVPRALQLAIDEDVEFRRSLPRDYFNYMGVAFSDSENPKRTSFLRKVEQLMTKMVSYCPVDAACDQMAVQFQRDSLPPVLADVEKECSIHGNGEYWDGKEMRVRGAVEIEPDTTIKLIRKGCIRLVSEDEKVSIYHNLENARVWHGNDQQWVEITAEAAPAVEYLLHAYPKYVKVDSLPLDTTQEKVDIASLMYEKGMLITAEPLRPQWSSCDEDDEEDDE